MKKQTDIVGKIYQRLWKVYGFDKKKDDDTMNNNLKIKKYKNQILSTAVNIMFTSIITLQK